MNLYSNIKNNLNEDENVQSGMTLYDYIKNVCNGEIDMDVCDNDIDMMVAFCHNINEHSSEYPQMERFLNLLAKRTKIIKQNNGEYAPILICDFSSTLKPYNEEWKKFFDMDYSEFDEDEAYYEAVVNLEPLISGNAGEDTYKEFCDIMEGKKLEESEEENEEQICVICNKPFTGWGNDAWPVAEGYCCDECNFSKVIPARLAQLREYRNDTKIKESESFKLNKDAEDFEDLVKRDFQNYIEDTYNIQNVQELADRLEHVTEEDINDYFTTLFYEIFDNEDMETANLAEEIIRKEYGLQDNINESEKQEKLNEADGFRLSIKEIRKLLDTFVQAVGKKGLKAHIHINDRNLGNGGTADFDDNHFISIHIFPYPKEIFIELIENYELNILDGKTVDKYELREFNDVDTEGIPFINNSIDSIFKKYKGNKMNESAKGQWTSGFKKLDGYTEEEAYKLLVKAANIELNSFAKNNHDNEELQREFEEKYNEPFGIQIGGDTVGNYGYNPKYLEFLNSKGNLDEAESSGLPNISKFIYDLDVNDGNAWSVQDYTKNGRGDKIIVVSRNGQSNNSAKDIIKAVEKSYPNLKGEPTINGRSIWFYLKESKLKEAEEPEEDKGLPFEERVERAYMNCGSSNLYPTIKNILDYLDLDDDSETRHKIEQIIYKKGYDWDVNEDLYEAEEKINPNNLTKEQLWKLRQEIRLNSIYTNDYENSFDLDPVAVQDFFDTFIEDMEQDDDGNPNNRKIEDYDNADDLYNFYTGCENPFGEIEEIKESEKQDKEIVWKYLDLPYRDFKANNTIGLLMDKTPFIVCDDNLVYLFDEPMSLADLKYKTYQIDDDYEGGYINKYFEEHCKLLDNNDSRVIPILVEIGRMPKDALDESEELELNEYKDFNHVNDVWEYLEDSKSLEDLNNRIKDIDPKKFGSIYYDLHDDNKGATVIIDYSDDNEDYYEKVDIYFDEDINESEDWEDHNDDPIECTIEYEEDGRPYFMYNNEKEYIDEYMKDEAGGAVKPLTAFSAMRIVPSDNGETVSVQYLHDSEKIKEAEDKEESKEEVKHKDDIQVYMNTWKNYNEYGADLDAYGIKDGWMNPDEALEFCKKYAEDEPFINDIDNNSGIDIEVSEYDNAPSVLEGLAKLNDVLYFGAGNAEKGDIPLVYEAWADKESATTPSLENIENFIDFLENGEYYVHNDVTSTEDIGKWYVENVGYEGVSNIENYIDSDQVKEDWQEDIDQNYLDDDGNPTEDWYEVDDSMVEEDIEAAKQGNDTNFFDKYFDYESLGDDIYGDGYWYVTDNGSVEIY